MEILEIQFESYLGNYILKREINRSSSNTRLNVKQIRNMIFGLSKPLSYARKMKGF